MVQKVTEKKRSGKHPKKQPQKTSAKNSPKKQPQKTTSKIPPEKITSKRVQKKQRVLRRFAGKENKSEARVQKTIIIKNRQHGIIKGSV